MKNEGKPVAANVEKLLASGKSSWYADDPKAASGRAYFDTAHGNYKPEEVPAGVWSVTVAKKSNGVVKKNAGASLVDLGDGVGCIEFHSKMNSLGGDIVQMITSDAEAGRRRRQLRRLRHHQRRRQLLRRRQHHDAADGGAGRGVGRSRHGHPPVPEHDAGHQVFCQAGGGRAVRHDAWAADARSRCMPRLASRTPSCTAGLVEVGVGLLPGGGGCKEMTLRAVRQGYAHPSRRDAARVSN